MIYPATLNIEILQNSTFKTIFRVLQRRRNIQLLDVIGGNPVFTIPCHKLTANAKVVVAPTGAQSATLVGSAPVADVPCGMDLNQVYFVSSSGLTTSTFTISATSGGSPITVANTLVNESEIVIAEPADLTGYTVDADLIDPSTNLQVATFTCALETPADGLCSAMLSPTTTAGLSVKNHKWDVSLTSNTGERYYYLTGDAPVTRTYSRNA